MAGELTIKDWSADNLGTPTNFSNPYVVAELDTTNSTAVSTGVVLPSGANSNGIGIVYETSKLDPSGNVVKNTGVVLRTWGIARVSVLSATAVGDLLKVANASGQVATLATSASWQNIPVIGRGITSSSALNDRPLVMLTIGSRI